MGVSSEAIYWACADVLILAAKIASSHDLPAPGDLRARLVGLLDRMVAEARAGGVPEAEIAEARYALVAFIDERVLRSTWPGRAEWMNQPLQLLLYREYAAGENFFARMRTVLHHGGYPRALEIYYLCLALGFRGAYHGTTNADLPESFLDAARQYFARSMPVETKLAQHAIPRDRAEAEHRGNGLLIGVLAACGIMIVAVLSVLEWSLHAAVSDAVQTLASAVR